jgi:hypothetical protein
MAKSAVGKVTRLSVHDDATYIQLDTTLVDGPKEGYFELKLDNQNYNSFYSLAIAAAVNQLPITIGAEVEFVATEYATVKIMLLK